MDVDKTIEEIISFRVEREEFDLKYNKKKKVFRLTESSVKKLVLDRLSGKTGEC